MFGLLAALCSAVVSSVCCQQPDRNTTRLFLYNVSDVACADQPVSVLWSQWRPPQCDSSPQFNSSVIVLCHTANSTSSYWAAFWNSSSACWGDPQSMETAVGPAGGCVTWRARGSNGLTVTRSARVTCPGDPNPYVDPEALFALDRTSQLATSIQDSMTPHTQPHRPTADYAG